MAENLQDAEVASGKDEIQATGVPVHMPTLSESGENDEIGW